jgi:hypothetical protein
MKWVSMGHPTPGVGRGKKDSTIRIQSKALLPNGRKEKTETRREKKKMVKVQVSNRGNFRRGFQYRIRDRGHLSRENYRMKLISGKTVYVHRIVAAAFTDKIRISDSALPDNFEVDHVDGNRDNNRIENLQIVSPVENKRKAQHPGSKKVSKRVKAKNPETGKWKEYSSQSKASKDSGVSGRAVSMFLKNGVQTKATKGWIFQRVQNERDIPREGEIFRRHPTIGTIDVSNHGRVRFLRDDRITDGNMDIGAKLTRYRLTFDKVQYEVSHLDHNTANNRIENLRWATLSEVNSNRRDFSNHGFTQGIPTSVRRKGEEAWVNFKTLGKCAEYLKTKSCDLRSRIQSQVQARALHIASGCDPSIPFCVGTADDEWEVKYTDDFPPAGEEGELWRDIPEDVDAALVKAISAAKE